MKKIPTRPLKIAELEVFFGKPALTLQNLLRRAKITSSQLMPMQLIKKMYKKGHGGGFDSARGTLWRDIRGRMEEFVDGLVEQGSVTLGQAKKLKEGDTLPAEAPLASGPLEDLPEEMSEVEGQGIEAAIIRLRGAEKFLHAVWKREMSAKEKYRSVVADKLFNQWQKAIEHLRKGEESLLVLQVKAGTLIEVDVARRYYAERILPIKKKLERIPSQYCTILENETAEAIKEELASAIRGVLGDFSEDLEDASS